MGKRSGSKKKKKHYLLKPPLTVLDTAIYVAGLLASTVLIFGLIIAGAILLDHIAFSDSGAIAYFSGAGTLLAIPFCLTIICFTFVPIVCGLSDKRPILGNPKIRYGEPPFREDCIPLIRRKKHHIADRPSHKAVRRFIVILCVVVLFISAVPLPFSIYNRTALYSNNSIKKFNIINQATKTYTPDDFESITISAKYVSNGGRYTISYRWESRIKIKMSDGRSIQFSIDDFNFRIPDAKDVYLDKMLELKSILPADAITIEGAENVERVADEWDFTKEQTEKLKKIFS